MRCPVCNHGKSQVVSSLGWIGAFQRLRCCALCGATWATKEIVLRPSIKPAAGKFFGSYGPDWPVIRGQVIWREGGACRRCRRADRALDVHHIVPARKFSSVDEANVLSNLEALCKSCHRKADKAYQRSEGSS